MNAFVGARDTTQTNITDSWRNAYTPQEYVEPRLLSGHEQLDLVGMVPFFGGVADGVNVAWYLSDGEYKNAAMSGVGFIPFLGEAVVGKRLAKAFSIAGKVCASFREDTPVVMADGSRKRIDEVEVGDIVLAPTRNRPAISTAYSSSKPTLSSTVACCWATSPTRH